MSKHSRRKFTAEFKTKVVLESLKERSSIEEFSRKYELFPTQINHLRSNAKRLHVPQRNHSRLYALCCQLGDQQLHVC